MPWIKSADRLPPDGQIVNASNRNGSILPMRVRDGRWYYAHRWERTKFDIVGWFEGEPKLATEEETV